MTDSFKEEIRDRADVCGPADRIEGSIEFITPLAETEAVGIIEYPAGDQTVSRGVTPTILGLEVGREDLIQPKTGEQP